MNNKEQSWVDETLARIDREGKEARKKREAYRKARAEDKEKILKRRKELGLPTIAAEIEHDIKTIWGE